MVTALALAFILVVGVVSDGIIFTLPEYYDERFGRIDIIGETKDDVQVLPSFTNELETDNSNILRAGFIQQQRTTIGPIQGYVFGIDHSVRGLELFAAARESDNDRCWKELKK